MAKNALSSRTKIVFILKPDKRKIRVGVYTHKINEIFGSHGMTFWIL